MTHLVDSDVAIDVLKGRPEAASALRAIRRKELSISAISIVEIMDGLAGGPAPDIALAGFRRFMRGLRVRVVNRAIGERTGLVRAELRARNRPVDERALDLVIAATALEHQLILITRNVKDYRDIPGLRLYSWDEIRPM
jgi:predicted nucleic acid-binding protein